MVLYEDYCSYELSKKLEELGADLYSQVAYRWYNDNCQMLLSRHEMQADGVAEKYITNAPTLALARKWFRIEKHIIIVPTHYGNKWMCNISDTDGNIYSSVSMCDKLSNGFGCPENALAAGLEVVADILIKSDTLKVGDCVYIIDDINKETVKAKITEVIGTGLNTRYKLFGETCEYLGNFHIAEEITLCED